MIRGKWQERPQRPSPHEELSPIIQEIFKRSEGNAVRIQEILESEYGRKVSYSTLTRIVRDLDLREDKKKRRSGTYEFGPGQEMQHDTSPHPVLIGDKKVKAQCAGGCETNLWVNGLSAGPVLPEVFPPTAQDATS